MDALETLHTLLPVAGPITVVDGGYHLGAYARSILSLRPEARVIGVEPDPETWARAARQPLAARLELVQAALGAAPGRAEFFRGPVAATHSLLPRPAEAGRPYYPARAALTGGTFVDVVTLDDLLAARGIGRVHLLKLDLQGAELQALHGARRLLAAGGAEVIQCEVVFVRKYAGQPLFWEICAHLAGAGYRLHSFTNLRTGSYDAGDTPARQAHWNQADAVFLSPAVQHRLDAGGGAAPG